MIHHVYANRSNAGDWLSARGIQRLLEPQPLTEHWCDVPFIPETLRALSEATPQDFVVIGGGGLFAGYFAPFWEGFARISRTVPFCIWGVGCCAARSAGPLRLPPAIEDVVAHSQLCIVRDELTRAQFSPHALPPPVACPAVVAVDPRPPAKQPAVLHVDHYNDVGPEVFERMEALVREFAERTGRAHLRTNNVIPKNDDRALDEVLARYAAADVVVSSRLHGCLIALAMGRRVIAVAADAKVEAFMRAAGLGGWVCTPDDLHTLPSLLATIDEQQPANRFIERSRNANRDIARVVQSIAARAQRGALPMAS